MHDVQMTTASAVRRSGRRAACGAVGEDGGWCGRHPDSGRRRPRCAPTTPSGRSLPSGRRAEEPSTGAPKLRSARRPRPTRATTTTTEHRPNCDASPLLTVLNSRRHRLRVVPWWHGRVRPDRIDPAPGSFRRPLPLLLLLIHFIGRRRPSLDRTSELKTNPFGHPLMYV